MSTSNETIDVNSAAILRQLYEEEPRLRTAESRRQTIQKLARKATVVHVALMEVDPDRAERTTDPTVFADGVDDNDGTIVDVVAERSWGLPITMRGEPNGDRIASERVMFVERDTTVPDVVDELTILIVSPDGHETPLVSFTDNLATLEEEHDPLDEHHVPDSQFNSLTAGYDELLVSINSALGIAPPELTVVE